jgi:hypothetical protein
MPEPSHRLRGHFSTFRIEEPIYKALRCIAYRLNMKLIDILHEQYVPEEPVRKA